MNNTVYVRILNLANWVKIAKNCYPLYHKIICAMHIDSLGKHYTYQTHARCIINPLN